MSLECSECEHDIRGGHAEDCSRRERDPDVQLKVDLVMETMNELTREKVHMAVVHAYMHVAGNATRSAINTIYAELEARGEPTEVCGSLAGIWNAFAQAIMPFHLEVPCDHEEHPDGNPFSEDHSPD